MVCERCNRPPVVCEAVRGGDSAATPSGSVVSMTRCLCDLWNAKNLTLAVAAPGTNGNDRRALPGRGGPNRSSSDKGETHGKGGQGGGSGGVNGGPGAATDGLAALGSALVKAAETKPANAADPNVSIAFAPGWHMSELYDQHLPGKDREPADLPGLGELRKEQSLLLVVNQVQAGVNSLGYGRASRS